MMKIHSVLSGLIMLLCTGACTQSLPPTSNEQLPVVSLVEYRPIAFAPLHLDGSHDQERGFNLISVGDLERTPRDYVRATATIRSTGRTVAIIAFVDIIDQEFRGAPTELQPGQEAEISVDIQQVGRPISMLRTVRLYIKGSPVDVLSLRLTCTVEKLPEPDVTVQGTKDHTSIQAALDSLSEDGGVVYIPAGVYEIRDQIVLPCSNVTIYGDGRDTVLKATWYESKALLTMDGKTNVRVTRLRFRGWPQTAFRGYTERAHAATISDVGRKDNVMTSAVDVLNCDNVRFDHCTVELFGHTGLFIRGKGLALVDHCFFQKNFRYGYGYGVVPHATEECFIEDNNFENHRHGVAGSANSMATYICRFNRFVKDVHAVPAEGWSQVNSHEIDVHHGCGWLYAHDNYVEMKNGTMSSAVALRGNSAWVWRHLIVSANIGIKVLGDSDGIWTWDNNYRNVRQLHSSTATGRVHFDRKPLNFSEITYPNTLNHPGWWPGAGNKLPAIVRPHALFHGPAEAPVLQPTFTE
jgi:hypothetical protein